MAENAGTWPVQRDAVSLDPYTGAVTETVLWQGLADLAKLTRIGILAHMGSLFGLVSQLALVAIALGLLSVIFWGYRMWWQRRPTRDAFRLTPPVRRGTLRALSQPASFAVVLLDRGRRLDAPRPRREPGGVPAGRRRSRRTRPAAFGECGLTERVGEACS